MHVGHNDPRWQEIVDLIWHFIHDIDDLEKIDSILYKFDSTEFYDPKLFFNRTTKENIIFPFLSNLYFDENVKYITDLIDAVINNRWDTFDDKYLTASLLQAILKKEDLLKLNAYGEDVLLAFLALHVDKRDSFSHNIQSLSNNNPLFDNSGSYSFPSYEINSLSSSASLSSVLSAKHKVTSYKKSIIDNLLKFRIKEINTKKSSTYRKWYFKPLKITMGH